MKLPILDKDQSYEETFENLEKDTNKVGQAIKNNNKVNLIEDSLEVIQVVIGLLDKMHKEGFDIRQAIMRHEKELLIKRSFTYSGWIEFEVFKKFT